MVTLFSLRFFCADSPADVEEGAAIAKQAATMCADLDIPAVCDI